MSRLLFLDVSETTDADLLRRISQEDEAALAALYDRYRTILFGLLIRILHNRAEAEDVLQEVFVQIWQKAQDFDDSRGKVFTWLVIIARSRAISRLRSIRAKTRTIETATRESTRPNSHIIENAIERKQRQAVQAALNELPEDQRIFLLMAYFEGFSQSEIAAQTDTPLGTVKTKMRTAMTTLRQAKNLHLHNWL